MITYLKGNLADANPTHLVVEVGGIGYELKITLNTYTQVKDQKKIHIHTHLHIKEDAHTLYGFYDDTERKCFLDLLSISGVGPNTALMVLSSMDVITLQNTIANEDAQKIQTIKGIGNKTAQRIVLELKDKIQKENISPSVGINTLNKNNTMRFEALSALLTLGMNKSVAEKKIVMILKKSDEKITLEELIRQALKI